MLSKRLPARWQTSWGMTALPNYTALIIGIVGVAMYQPQTLEVGLGRVSRTEAEMSGLL